jgi:large subunit ribosomal protein L15
VRLSDLRPNPGARHKSKRVGRGPGSGRMKTAGRGQKGQKARSGGGVPAYFEGGQNRFSQRMPYLGGFKNPFRTEFIEINVDDLAVFAPGSEVTPQTLAEQGLIRPRQATKLIKVLGNGALNRALNVTAHKFSGSARAKIEAAGGSVALLALPKRAKRHVKRLGTTAKSTAQPTA